MALNLARVQESIDARRRGTTNRDYTLPSRRETRAPDLEVNANITRPNSSGSDILLRTLGLATDAAMAAGGLAMEARQKKDKERSAQAGVDFGLGIKNEEQYQKFKAYKDAYDTEGAKRSAFQLDQLTTANVQALLEDEEEPATLEEVASLIDTSFTAALTSPDGKLVEFPTEAGKKAVAAQMSATRNNLMQKAEEIIRNRMNAQMTETVSSNISQELLTNFAARPDDPLPTAPKLLSDTPKAAPSKQEALPGLPVSDYRLTSAIGSRKAPKAGASTMHGGADLAVPEGTPVEVRAGGKATVKRTPKGGLEVHIDHGNGVVSSYLHLSETKIKDGQEVGAGDVVALTGQTGNVTGPHLHYGIKVDGKAVDPMTYKWDRGFQGSPGSQPVPPAPAEQGQRPLPQVNVEADIARFPPAIDRKTAKASVIQSYVTAAGELKRPDILDALWQSKKADGSNSFSPTEINTIREARDALANNVRLEATRKKNEEEEANVNAFVQQWNEGKAPTVATVNDWVAKGLFRATTGRSFINAIEADNRQAEAEARGDRKEAERELENDIAYEVGVEADSIQMGNGNGMTASKLRQRLDSGEFGTGRKAITHYNRLLTALRVGAQANPETAKWAKSLEVLHKPKKSTGAAAAIRGSANDPLAQAAYAQMQREYKNLVEAWTAPGAAYLAVVSKYGDKTNPEEAKSARKVQRDAEIKALRDKQ